MQFASRTLSPSYFLVASNTIAIVKTLQTLSDDPRVIVRNRNAPNLEGECVVYWMRRSQRGEENDALNIAIEAANLLRKPIVVFFAVVPASVHANLRHYAFMAQGIPDIAASLAKRNVSFVFRAYPNHSILKFCEEVPPVLVVSDENPLRESADHRNSVARKLRIPLWTVDSDVIVPSKLLLKEQYAAHIMRKRLGAHLDKFLIATKDAHAHISWKKPRQTTSLAINADLLRDLRLDCTVQPVSSLKGGTREAKQLLREFVKHKLAGYPRLRNHPECDGTSKLSPYLHFGHIGPKTIVLAVKAADAPQSAKAAFLDQLITWRELAINLVTFNPDYDNFEAGEPWALRTLGEHQKDARPVRYGERQLENAETYDPLWNAAQMQMVNEGWMHNYVRMYWAKKILEWSPSAAAAYRIAMHLNDKYEIDGRDPNGYAGIAWSIVGKFDRPWVRRPIFGMIRYMSLASTGKKFDSQKYISQIQSESKTVHPIKKSSKNRARS